jgi:hypothetical protein
MSEATHDGMDMPAESNTVASQTPAPKRRNHRKAHKPFDRRFVLGKRVQLLAAIFAERLSLDTTDPDPVLAAAIEKAARLTALAEQASARALRADPAISLDDLVRLQRLADLAVRRLHLDRRTKEQPSLADVLRSQGGAP